MATILVVDEDGRTRFTVQACLGQLGHEVLQVSDAEAARTLCEKSMPDLIIADVSMPLLSGVSFVGHVSAIKGDVRVIGISAQTFSGSGLKENSPKVDAVVRKPIDEKVLVTAVQRLIKSG